MSSADTFDGAEEVRRAWMAGLAPDPSLTVSQWADRHRVISSPAASEAGPYRTARTPYMKAVMDALSPRHPAQRVVFMKAAQVGATEAGNNWIGFCMHRAPGPFLAVQPTVDLAKRLSQQQIDPLMRMARTCANAWNLSSCALRELGRCLRNARAALFC